MASLTTGHLLFALRQTCQRSALVHYLDVLTIDADILHVRVHLTFSEAFISVFYNVATNKTAFALVENEKRIFGVDNAKGDWHQHPFSDPGQHIACEPMEFGEFLDLLETYYMM